MFNEDVHLLQFVTNNTKTVILVFVLKLITKIIRKKVRQFNENGYERSRVFHIIVYIRKTWTVSSNLIHSSDDLKSIVLVKYHNNCSQSSCTKYSSCC